jgi:putative ABC transport system substrate-binding protein
MALQIGDTAPDFEAETTDGRVDNEERHRLIARYVDRIFRGENPANLPFYQPTNFLLTINLRVAKTLGITMPPALLVRADEVIE